MPLSPQEKYLLKEISSSVKTVKINGEKKKVLRNIKPSIQNLRFKIERYKSNIPNNTPGANESLTSFTSPVILKG